MFSKNRMAAAIAGGVFVFSQQIHAGWGYLVTDLGTLGGPSSSASAINANGDVAGSADVGGGATHAFLYQNGLMRDLGTLGGTWSYASAVNASGQVVGGSSRGDGQLDSRPFLYQFGFMSELIGLASQLHPPTGINDQGVIVGSYEPGDLHPYRGYRIENGFFSDLGFQGDPTAINAQGQIVGATHTPAGYTRAFLFNGPGQLIDLGSLNGTWSLAMAINAAGQVVGVSAFGGGGHGSHGFLWDNGLMIDLGTLGGSSPTRAKGINAFGQIVGDSVTATGAGHGFVRVDGRMADLNDLIDSSSVWTVKQAAAINDSGQIAATGVNAAGASHALLLTPTTGVPTTPPLAAAIQPSSLYGAVTPAGNQATVTVTGAAAVSGGRPPYSYAWRLAGGQSGITIHSPTQAATMFSALLPMCESAWDTAILKVTDAIGRVTEARATVHLRALRRPRAICQ